jgi:lysophospholipase L1-like esterase
MTAYKEILNLAEKKKIGILVYIQPIRNDMKIPYDLNEYNLFKKEIATISEISGAYFSNLENIVPNEFWGQTASINLKNYKDLDFMHFQAEGHQLLSKNILYEFNKINK